MSRDDQKSQIWPMTLSGSQGHHQPCLCSDCTGVPQLWPGARTPFQLLQGSTPPWPGTRTLNCESLPQKCHSRTSLQSPHSSALPGHRPISNPMETLDAWDQGWRCLGLGLPLLRPPCCCHPGISPYPPLVAPWWLLYKTTSALWTMPWDHFPPVPLSLALAP